VQSIHEDLDSTKFYAGWDFVGPYYFDKFNPILPDDDPRPSPVSKIAHGMCVAGIISATTDNGVGISGIAPECLLMRLKISDDSANLPHPYPPYDTTWWGLPSICAQAIEYAYMNGADVINGSWGWRAPFWYWDVIADALEEAMADGVVSVFSAGNDSTVVKFPAWLPTTIAVGAIQPNGDRWPYSNRSAELEVVVPSGDLRINQEPGVYTLDIVGDSGGYNDYFVDCTLTTYDYMCDFGGTSAAAPQVSGIAALILSRIPDYWRELLDSDSTGWYLSFVLEVIRYSALDQIGDPEYDHPGWDMSYGWGVANGFRALLAITRGDVDNSGGIDIADIVYLSDYMYNGGSEPDPDVRVGDFDCSGGIDISDMVALVDYVFFDGAPPATPCYVY
jgi:subtilisin family serine protease